VHPADNLGIAVAHHVVLEDGRTHLRKHGAAGLTLLAESPAMPVRTEDPGERPIEIGRPIQRSRNIKARRTFDGNILRAIPRIGAGFDKTWIQRCALGQNRQANALKNPLAHDRSAFLPARQIRNRPLKIRKFLVRCLLSVGVADAERWYRHCVISSQPGQRAQDECKWQSDSDEFGELHSKD
jgi:hypothetical protein